MSKLIKYLPNYYESAYEIVRLTDTEDWEFEQTQQEIDAIFDNQFILSAREKGISDFESIYGIENESMSLEFRRQRLLSRVAMSQSYTLPFLRQQLDLILGADRYWMAVHYDQYRVQVVMTVLDLDRQAEANALMARIVPCNMLVDMQTILPDTMSGMTYTAAVLGEYITERFGGNI